MGTMMSQITSLTIVYSTVYSGADQRKHQSSASLAFVRGIQRGPVNSPHKWPVTRKMFPFDDVIMIHVHGLRSHVTFKHLNQHRRPVWSLRTCIGSHYLSDFPVSLYRFHCILNIVEWLCQNKIICVLLLHDDVTEWKHFPRYWPFVRGIPRSTVNSPHKSQ